MFELLKKKPEKDGEKGKKPKKQNAIILIGALVGIALLLFGGKLSQNKKEPAAAVSETSIAEELEAYRDETEERVRALCASVRGVGDVRVMITFEGGFTSVYATETKNGGESVVVIGSGSSASALLLTKATPAVAGIGVVCRGGGNATVRAELTSLLCAAFHLPSTRVYVTESG